MKFRIFNTEITNENPVFIRVVIKVNFDVFEISTEGLYEIEHDKRTYEDIDSGLRLSIDGEHKIYIDDFGIIRHLETFEGEQLDEIMKKKSDMGGI